MNSIIGSRVASLLPPLVIADLVLLPMFHFGEIPWKPSLLLIVGLSLVHLRRKNFTKLRRAAPVMVLSILLISSTITGTLTYWLVAGVVPNTDTLRLLVIFVLIPASFIFGLNSQRANHVYVGWLIVAIVTLNTALFALPDQLSSVVRFFDLDQSFKLKPHLYDPSSVYARPTGIFQNSNISGLAISVLMTYMVVGLKWGFFRTNPVLFALFSSAGLFGVLMLLGRTQIAITIPIMVAALLWSHNRQRLAIVVSTLFVLIATGFIPSPGASAAESFIGLDISERVIGGFSEVVDVGLETSFAIVVVQPTPANTATPVIEPTTAVATTTVVQPTPTATTTTDIEPTTEVTPTTVVQPTPEPITTPVADSIRIISSPLMRPFMSWDRARARIVNPSWISLTGTGPEPSPDYGDVHYHNDWISVLVSGGILGILSYVVLVAYFGGISILLAMPFFLPGMVNAFLMSPQFIVLISVLAGIVTRYKIEARRVKNHDLDIVYVVVDRGLSIDNSPVLKTQVIDAATSLASGGYRIGLIANVETQNSASLSTYTQQFSEVRTVRDARLPLMILKSAWQLNSLNRQHSIRKLYVRGIWGAVIAHIAFPTFIGPELVYDFRGDVVAEAENSGIKGIRMVILRMLTQLAIRSAAKHLSVSDQGAAKLMKNYGVNTVSVIPSSTDTHRFDSASTSRSETRKQLGFSDDDIVYIYAGGLARYQMIPEMLALWSKLDKENARFILLTSKQSGNNIDASEYESLIPPGTVVLSLDPKDVPTYLVAADIGFLLREQDPLNIVASPVKFAEYLAAGLAVVTTPALSDASQQVLDHNVGVIISPQPNNIEFESLDEFTKIFVKQRQQFRKDAIRLAQSRYDWDAHLEIWRKDIFDLKENSSDD